MTPRRFDDIEQARRDEQHRAENRRAFFLRRERAANEQLRRHLSITGRAQCGALAIEMARGFELFKEVRWRWVRE